MNILFINSVCGIGSTGKICEELATKLENEGHTVKIAYGRAHASEKSQKYAVRIGGALDNKISALHTRITDKHGLANKRATKKFLAWADAYDPDILWLHNLHGYYINIELLFAWIKSRPQMQVKWTLHDCWAFTGHCSYFTFANCEQWKTQCRKCSQKRYYPKSFLFDNCRQNFLRKRNAFTGVNNLTLIVPSHWLAELTRQSFLKEYPVEIVHNTIDTSVFKPTPSDFRKQYGLEDKKLILGVAFGWGSRKGYDDFLALSSMLDETYRIVLVGVTKKQQKHLPPSVIGICKTNSKQKLAEIYSACDVFVNLTYEDNYPTVNLEARACGLPIITYRAGGSAESAGADANVVDAGDINAVFDAIVSLPQKGS